jgi:acetyltransferase-like isoleucine patch superfamily enzyme
LTTEHQYSAASRPIKTQPVTELPVVIEDNVWLGANVTILGGVTLRSGTIVAAGAVVTKTFDEPDVILAGVPARILKRLN